MSFETISIPFNNTTHVLIDDASTDAERYVTMQLKMPGIKIFTGYVYYYYIQNEIPVEITFTSNESPNAQVKIYTTSNNSIFYPARTVWGDAYLFTCRTFDNGGTWYISMAYHESTNTSTIIGGGG